MFTQFQSPSLNAATFQGQQGGGPIIAGVPDDARPLHSISCVTFACTDIDYQRLPGPAQPALDQAQHPQVGTGKKQLQVKRYGFRHLEV